MHQGHSTTSLTRRCVIIGLLQAVQRANVLNTQIAIFLYVVIVYVRRGV